MNFEDVEKEYKMIAPDIDELISFCDNGPAREVLSTLAIVAAIEPLFEILNPLAPIKRNDAVKEIWIRVPRGTIEDYDDNEQWLHDYPDEMKWYRLSAVKYLETDGKLRCYGLDLNEEKVISAVTKWRSFDEPGYYDEKAFEKLCELIAPAVEESIKLLQDGKYNDIIAKELPYRYRKGVIKRFDLWIADPKYKEEVYRADYIGIVPVHMSEDEFIDRLPDEYGYIDDCMYADEVKDSWYDKIIWFPEEPEILQ